jgi:hypothetical protein
MGVAVGCGLDDCAGDRPILNPQWSVLQSAISNQQSAMAN